MSMNNTNIEHIPQEKFQFVQMDASLHDNKLETKARSYFADAMIRFRKNKSSVVAAWILLFLLVFSFLSPILSPYKDKLDALVLGCTHYPFVVPSIRRILGDHTRLFDGGEGTARHAMRRLQEADLLWDGPGCIVLENSKQERSILELSAKLLEVENG